MASIETQTFKKNISLKIDISKPIYAPVYQIIVKNIKFVLTFRPNKKVRFVWKLHRFVMFYKSCHLFETMTWIQKYGKSVYLAHFHQISRGCNSENC